MIMLHGSQDHQRTEKESRPSSVGRYTRILYDRLKGREGNVPAQLRTGMTRMGTSTRLECQKSDLCICGKAREMVKHFLFRRSRWDAQRTEMLAQAGTS